MHAESLTSSEYFDAAPIGGVIEVIIATADGTHFQEKKTEETDDGYKEETTTTTRTGTRRRTSVTPWERRPLLINQRDITQRHKEQHRARECERVFKDRLVDKQDHNWFYHLIKRQMDKHFKRPWDQVVKLEPVNFADFVKSFQMYLQKVSMVQPRMVLLKFANN